MRILVDEDLDVRLRHYFGEEHDVSTVQYQGWKGLKNGNLLAAASGTFEVLITADNHLPEQQNLAKFNIAVLVVRAESKLLDDLLPLMPEILRALPTLRPGTAGRVGVPPHTQPRRLG